MTKVQISNFIFYNFNRHRQFILFLAIGVLNAIFGYSVFSLLIFCGLHYTWAAFFGTCLGIIFNFKTIGGIVFKNHNYKLFFKFLCVYGFLYIVNIALIRFMLFFVSSVYIAGAIAVIICAMISYLLNKHLVFVRKI